MEILKGPHHVQCILLAFVIHFVSSKGVQEPNLLHLEEQEKLRLAQLEANILNGVDINVTLRHNYHNDTNSEKVSSSLGCPEPHNGKPWVYYKKNGEIETKCYLAGSQGGCPDKMFLLAQKGSNYGFCNCCERLHRHKECCMPSNDDYTMLAYVKKWNSCQVIFDQGLCPTGEWLVFGNDISLGPFCEPRRCPPATDGRSFYHIRTKECKILGKACEPGPSGLIFKHISNAWYPRCVNKYYVSRGNVVPSREPPLRIPPTIQNSCPKFESYNRLLEKCVKNRIRNQLNSTYLIG